ncbi:MAG: hypothetical protein HQM02_13735, partial [Magnetococcales bacterium]|nr:hypothetical protein [Magnetococcales bacterium]
SAWGAGESGRMTTDWQRAVGDLQQACRDAFGIPVTYYPSLRNRPELAGRGVAVVGVLDDRRETLTIMGSNGVETVVPNTTLDLRLADLGFAPLEGDEVVVNAASYRVRDVLADGQGAALLTLDRLPSP